MLHSDTLEQAIVRTLAYVDVFDYPLTAAEIHHYLMGLPAPAVQVNRALQNGRLSASMLSRRDGYFTLRGREAIVATRQRREAGARQMWREATHYGRRIAALPFVRMVAVTGSLAVNNVEPAGDIDYLIVTANDRLWLCRAFTILLVRLAERRGVTLCPNYLLSERALRLNERNLYTAHELAQMIPLAGIETYRRMRQLNDWTAEWLPNATDLPPHAAHIPKPARQPRRAVQRLAEPVLRGSIGARVEQWEMTRKVRKFTGQVAARESAAAPKDHEIAFSADWCKGHFDGHGNRVLHEYERRLEAVGYGG